MKAKNSQKILLRSEGGGSAARGGRRSYTVLEYTKAKAIEKAFVSKLSTRYSSGYLEDYMYPVPSPHGSLLPSSTNEAR